MGDQLWQRAGQKKGTDVFKVTPYRKFNIFLFKQEVVLLLVYFDPVSQTSATEAQTLVLTSCERGY